MTTALALIATGLALAFAVLIAATNRRKPTVYEVPMEWQADEYQPNKRGLEP